jgi:hypothetical protein
MAPIVIGIIILIILRRLLIRHSLPGDKIVKIMIITARPIKGKNFEIKAQTFDVLIIASPQLLPLQ